MSEQRIVKRKQLIYYLSVFDRSTEQFIGQLVDITTKGMMLTCEEPVKTKVIFQCRLVLPEVINGQKQILFDAESLWCKKDVNPNFFDVGFRFIDVSEKIVNIIENLIYDFSFIS